MEDKKSQELALFRFSLIAPVINDTYEAPSLSEFFRQVAAKSHTLPGGTSTRFSSGTIKKWYLHYKHAGFDALIPKTRNDVGKPRSLNLNAIEKIHSIKEQLPYITGTLVYSKLVEDGYIKASSTSKATVLRYIRENNLKRNQLNPVDRRAFEMEFANDCWQSDTSHGPVILVDGHKRQAYLMIFIDDASRLILHGEFFFNDNSVNLQSVFKKAISKYGIPKRTYVDNGSSFKNEQLSLICASLGTALIHTAPYTPQQKGKVERVFRTIKDRWMNAIDWNDFHSLEELNSDFNIYLNKEYSNSIHSALNVTPRERFLKDIDKIKRISPEELDNRFLHRVTRKVNSDATISLNTNLFETPAKYIGQKINVRYSPIDLERAYVFDNYNSLLDTIFPLKRVENSKVKRNTIDYSKVTSGGNANV
ncbi:MAG: DDE-type integrase/transposase/recombinase [Clostridiaceae bacterium]|nr:DDE-type integrase/transposase/recombinase [Clostridiaceae bacterium]